MYSYTYHDIESYIIMNKPSLFSLSLIAGASVFFLAGCVKHDYCHDVYRVKGRHSDYYQPYHQQHRQGYDRKVAKRDPHLRPNENASKKGYYIKKSR